MPKAETQQTGDSSIITVPATYQRFIKEPIKTRITAVGRKEFVKNYQLKENFTVNFFQELH